jgi:hypothetical protein
MPMRRLLFNIISSAFKSSKPATFGESRAAKMEERLNKAVTERRTLARAEAASEDPLKSTIGLRGDMVGRKIGRLQSELNSKK